MMARRALSTRHALALATMVAGLLTGGGTAAEPPPTSVYARVAPPAPYVTETKVGR